MPPPLQNSVCSPLSRSPPSHCGHWSDVRRQGFGLVDSPVVGGALGRALTTSFGSVCLGSLVVALLQLLSTIVHSARAQVSTPLRWQPHGSALLGTSWGALCATTVQYAVQSLFLASHSNQFLKP